jgi:hypothetical protein
VSSGQKGDGPLSIAICSTSIALHDAPATLFTYQKQQATIVGFVWTRVELQVSVEQGN